MKTIPIKLDGMTFINKHSLVTRGRSTELQNKLAGLQNT